MTNDIESALLVPVSIFAIIMIVSVSVISIKIREASESSLVLQQECKDKDGDVVFTHNGRWQCFKKGTLIQ